MDGNRRCCHVLLLTAISQGCRFLFVMENVVMSYANISFTLEYRSWRLKMASGLVCWFTFNSIVALSVARSNEITLVIDFTYSIIVVRIVCITVPRCDCVHSANVTLCVGVRWKTTVRTGKCVHSLEWMLRLSIALPRITRK